MVLLEDIFGIIANFTPQGLKIRRYEALLGATIATILSKGVYLVSSGIAKRV